MRRSSRRVLQQTAQRVRNSFTQSSQSMDMFHSLMALIDKNAEALPDGDYLEIANLIKEIRDKVKPPSFLLDQNEPMTMYQMPEYSPSIRSATPEQANVTVDVTLLHADWANTDNARYPEEDDDEDDDEYTSYRFNTVPDTLDIDSIPGHVYDAIMASPDGVTTRSYRRVSESDSDTYYEVQFPNGSTTTYCPQRHMEFIHR
tara:strand:- start:4310 stop:4915 length:606 start_codon:yes stop_codon:yes gene_type:complete